MTAGPVTLAGEDAAVSVAAVRSFLGRHRRRSWVDLYVDRLRPGHRGDLRLRLPRHPAQQAQQAGQPRRRHARGGDAGGRGAGLVIGVGMGLLLLAQALGPLALSPADASWLLLTPLARRAVLWRAAVTGALLATAAGALLGVLGLAMAGPYLRLAGSGLPGSWLFLSAVAGAGCCLAAVTAEMLAQPRERPRTVIRAACVAVAVVAMAGAVAGERWSAVTRAVTAVFGGLSTPVFDTAALVALVLAAVGSLLLWRAARLLPGQRAAGRLGALGASAARGAVL